MAKSDGPVAGVIGKPKVAPKAVIGYDVDVKRRLLVIRARGPLDIEDVLVAMPYASVKHVCGQLIQQEGEGEASGALLIHERLPEGS